MIREEKKIKILTVAAITLTGILPVLWYWLYVGRIPTVTAQEARDILSEPGSKAVLVDTRSRAEFDDLHIEGAVNWPHESIMRVESQGDMPKELEGNTLLLICNSGLMSPQAARKLIHAGAQEVFNVRGGMQEWTAAPDKPCPLALSRLESKSGETKDLPYKRSSYFEQWAASIAAFGIKPAYMLLSFVLIVFTWRLKSPDLSAFRWAMIFFFIGESFCAINYVFLGEDSHLVEYLHIFGMVLAFAFTTFALLTGLDKRIVRYSDPEKRCAAINLCGSCVKYGDAPCGARRVYLLLAAALIVLCFMPLLASFHADSYNTDILGVSYNYSHPVVFQLFEIRYAPITAIVFFAAAFAILWLNKGVPPLPAKALFAGGMGFYGFSMFRLVLFTVFRDNLVWYVVWEEVTELIYICGAVIVLWMFKKNLEDERTLHDHETPGPTTLTPEKIDISEFDRSPSVFNG